MNFFKRLIGKSNEKNFLKVVNNSTPDELLKLGKRFSTEGHFPASLACLFKAENIDPKNVEVLNLIATILCCLNMYGDSIKYSKKILKIDPKNKEAKNTKKLAEDLEKKFKRKEIKQK